MRDLFDHLEELPAPVRRVCKRFARILADGEYDTVLVCKSFKLALKTMAIRSTMASTVSRPIYEK